MPDLTVYDSLSGRKKNFTFKKRVTVYVCGVTPYDITHLGHAFTYVSFDLIIRYLEFTGIQVTYIQNVTDIDDDILRKAKASGQPWRKLAEVNFARFLDDLRWLNVRQPDFYPRATDHITEIISLVKKLLAKGYAYEKNGNVYFEIVKDTSYGKLSKLNREQMLPLLKERGGNPQDPDKKNPLDFILWRKQKKGEPAWESPWGNGRPGWHIECSAMSLKYLGVNIDMHGGGGDLIYPHHESELAQSEKATRETFVNFWMPTGMLYYQGEKMSKSLGNLVFISDLKEKYSANAVRLSLLSHHYRKEWEFHENEITRAEELNNLFKQLWLKQSFGAKEIDVTPFRKNFFSALDDDFNSPKALQALEQMATISIKTGKNITPAKAFLNRAFNILGLRVEY
ncbi:MAG: cysteinyl-tRNA synthetase, L-cysteine:1D-myo-inositol 2-amino-2-deoxy-alpha-D-glucopyranoside ligase [Candidatus Gottesmanbacteria bacterium GW2011_GWA2_43_14]|uniref:Cysteine--tRNA ligase n=1 Tax=Candidatus Gottesmanbacteria bacterium GW2011_GWA2_43_14 TaxID=1618443 RepID=A0A0G1FMX3_9BACT|nr:MAG: cysteinyl-tRNA synthetase, L-cysteine:1D-myo-inositol 2-amino-2-deoxy-alpha-D-glucopyranoside ligase [Candidatus Gottesmanbacteria bacterium GW2011_GWA2_43_14]